jgi:hypothetical protein
METVLGASDVEVSRVDIERESVYLTWKTVNFVSGYCSIGE